MSDKGLAERSRTQPNAGWGVLCESCEHRIPPPRDSFPCREEENAELIRKSPLGRDITIEDKLGIHFWETCPRFHSVLPP